MRDFVLGRSVQDIDLATDARPEQVMALLAKADIKVVPTGVEHGTVTAVIAGRKFEVTTLRRDVETDGRHAVVEFGTDWQEDAARRIYLQRDVDDARRRIVRSLPRQERPDRRRRIRFVGEASQRVREDVLRILRWFRFYAHYGRPPLDESALSACKGFAFRLPDLSGERVRHELLRFLDATNPFRASS